MKKEVFKAFAKFDKGEQSMKEFKRSFGHYSIYKLEKLRKEYEKKGE